MNESPREREPEVILCEFNIGCETQGCRLAGLHSAIAGIAINAENNLHAESSDKDLAETDNLSSVLEEQMKSLGKCGYDIAQSIEESIIDLD